MIFDIISFNDYFNDRSKYFLVLILQIPLGNILSFGFFSSPVLSPQIEISETTAYPVIKYSPKGSAKSILKKILNDY